MKNLSKYFAVIFFALFSLTFSQSKDFTKEPGYVDFGELSDFDFEESVTEVYLEENLLKMVAKLSKESEPEVADLIGGLKMIRVNAFEISDKNAAKILERIESINKKLENKDWLRIIRVKSKSETVYVYVKNGKDDKFHGLVVLAFDNPGEAAFVNIVGDINLDAIGKLNTKFNIPALGKIDSSKVDGKNNKGDKK